MENRVAISSHNDKFTSKKASQESSVWSRIKSQLIRPLDNKERGISRKVSTPLIYIAPAPDSGDKREMNGNQGYYRKKSEVMDRSHLRAERSERSASDTRRLSKSEQTLNRLLRDQLQLAYSDHQNNMRNAQSFAALQQLRKSQPRLELSPSPSPSRGTSPHRRGKSRNRSPTNQNHRTHSPLAAKMSDGWSSGSEQSTTSNRSAPPGYRQARESHGQLPSGKCSPAGQCLSPASRSASQSRSSPNSPRGSNAGVSASDSSELIKHAHINLLWSFILDAIQTSHVENYGDIEPRIWWKRLFLVLKYKHGKGKQNRLLIIFYFYVLFIESQTERPMLPEIMVLSRVMVRSTR